MAKPRVTRHETEVWSMNRKILFILLLAVLSFTVVCYGNQKDYENKFKEGNGLYEKGDYRGAEKLYDDLIKSGVVNVALYYNAGNASFKTGSTGKAILYYERALRIAPRDEDIKQNLRYIRSVTVDKQTDEKSGIFSLLFSGLKGILSLNELTITVFILYVILFLGGLIYIFSDRFSLKFSLKITGMVIFSIFLVFSLFLCVRIYEQDCMKQGIIMVSQEKARSGPGEDYTEVFTIHEGSRVYLKDGLQDWRKITLPNGYSGWIKNKSVEEI
mgnify:FL=1